MKHTLVLVGGILLLGGCANNVVSSEIKPSEIYKGYPCFANCEAFKAGYELADKQALKEMDACSSFAENEYLGCKARVQEHIIKEREDNWMGGAQ